MEKRAKQPGIDDETINQGDEFYFEDPILEGVFKQHPGLYQLFLNGQKHAQASLDTLVSDLTGKNPINAKQYINQREYMAEDWLTRDSGVIIDNGTTNFSPDFSDHDDFGDIHTLSTELVPQLERYLRYESQDPVPFSYGDFSYEEVVHTLGNSSEPERQELAKEYIFGRLNEVIPSYLGFNRTQAVTDAYVQFLTLHETLFGLSGPYRKLRDVYVVDTVWDLPGQLPIEERSELEGLISNYQSAKATIEQQRVKS